MQYPKLKPQLLRSIIADHLSEENVPFSDPSKLWRIVSSIKLHGLLSEHFDCSPDQKLEKEWQAAVSMWTERLLSLCSSKMPDKCWIGVSLLGVTCQGCSGALFLTSYSSWFDKLLTLLKERSDSHFVKVACCAALSDIFMRLYDFPTCKKEGASLSSKLIPPILQLLAEDASDEILEVAIGLLCKLVNLFPSSFHRHYDNAEAVVATMLSRNSSSAISKMFAQLLAVLTRAKGDADSWSQMMTKLLTSINMHLNYVLKGFEDANKGMDAVNLLVERGKDLPSPLGGCSDSGYEQTKDKFGKLLIPHICTLMQCCITMLTSRYPMQVSVPVHSLLALVERVLSLDGNSCYASLPVMAITQLEFIFSDLSVLHLSCLDLLHAIIEGVRSQLLLVAGKIAGLLHNYFRRFLLPYMRVKLYAIAKALLKYMSAGMTPYLASDIIDNASSDLNSCIQGNGFVSPEVQPSKFAYGASNATRKRKRKHISGSPEDNSGGVEAELFSDQPKIPFSVQIFALRAIEALLTMGGSLLSKSLRPNVDLLLIHVAISACEEGWPYGQCEVIIDDDMNFSQADFQLAALEALLASLLSPHSDRPPYLSQGLALFRKGKQEAGAKVADFCARALLALEPLIHPRALQLMPPYLSSNTSNGGFHQRYDLAANENTQLCSVVRTEDISKEEPRNVNVILMPETQVNINATGMGGSTLEELKVDGSYKPVHIEDDSPETVGELKVDGSYKPVHIEDNSPETVGELKVDGSYKPVHIEDDSPETVGDGLDSELVKPVTSPSKEDAISADIADISAEDLFFNNFSSLNSSEIAALSSDSESLPEIVDGDPDSD